MANCVLTIDTVLGGPSMPLTDEICQTIVTVTGTVTDGTSGACPAVSVTVRCRDGLFEQTGGVTALGHLDGPATVSGYLVKGQWQIVLQVYCCCDRDMVVTASCAALGCSDSVSAPLECVSQCCPVVFGKAKTGPCDSTGHANVDFAVSTLIQGANCAPGAARLDWGDGSPFGQVHAIPAGQGGFTDSHVYAPGHYIARVVTSSPENCPSVGIAVTVDCPPPPHDCCPEIETVADCGPCDAHGISQVALTTAVLIPDDCPPATVRMDYGDGSSASHNFTASGQFTWPLHPYPAGQHSGSVAVTSPQGCPEAQFSFNVTCPPPQCCPQISASAKVGPCGPDGLAPVTFTANVQPAADPACPPVSWRYDFGDGILEPIRGPGTFSDVRPYTAGPHSATIKMLSPPGCGELPVNFNVHCPDCCPDVSIVPCIPDCGPDPDRIVKFEITVAPKGPPCPPKAIAFQMDFGDGNQGQALTIPAGGAALSYTETHTYSGADALRDNTAALTVSQPPECAGTYGSVVIPKCCKKKRANLCRTLFLLMSWTFTLAVLALLSALLGSLFSPQVSLNAFYVLAAAGVAMLIVFLILCTKCLCGWVYRLLWRVFFAAGLLYAIHAACTVYHWLTVLIGALMILLAFFFLRQWRKKCCASECDWLKEIVLWLGLVMAVAGFLLSAGLTGGCQFVLFTITIWIWKIEFTVFGVATILATILGFYYLKKCK